MKQTIKILLAAIVFIGIWSFFVEPNVIVVENVAMEIEGLPSYFDGLKIVHITDLHSKKFGLREKVVLRKISRLEPDFVFITGDMVDWTTRDLDSCQEFWRQLADSYPDRVFGVHGNHEHRNFEIETLGKFLEESGIEFLDNESRKIHREGDFVYLIGVDDPHLGYDDLEKAMAEVEGDNPKILLAHSPEIFRKTIDKDIDVVLVGHTHGCQINLPIICDLIIPLEYDKKYKQGLFKESSTYLYVNRGIGETFFPARFNAVPEIALITLKQK